MLWVLTGCSSEEMASLSTPRPPTRQPSEMEPGRLIGTFSPAQHTTSGVLDDALPSGLSHGIGIDLQSLSQSAGERFGIDLQDTGAAEEEAIDEELAPTAPFPDRTNPFEFAAGVDFDAPQAKTAEALNVKLYGFVGLDSPKAIVSVGGRTKTLATGEKWGVLEILDVSPPTVRIKTNGVIRVWSLLGHHEDSI